MSLMSSAPSTRGRELAYAGGMDGTTTPGSRHGVAVEILYAPGCPHLREVRGRLETVAVEEGFAISARETLIETVEQAQQRRFPGSPTMRVEGRDVEPEAESLELFGLGRRTYAGPGGSGG